MPVEAKQQAHYYTQDEYLAFEESADFRNEYHDGEIIAMTGGTFNHNRIAGNIYAALNFALKNQENYDIAMGDVKVWIPQSQRFLYPDVMVTTGQPQYYENRSDTITNPLVIIEVLSKSTQNYDKGDKFRYYRTLPSFQEYILISQYEYNIEQYTKISEYEWRIFYQFEPSAVLELTSFPFKIPLLDIYNKVDFDAKD